MFHKILSQEVFDAQFAICFFPKSIVENTLETNYGFQMAIPLYVIGCSEEINSE